MQDDILSYRKPFALTHAVMVLTACGWTAWRDPLISHGTRSADYHKVAIGVGRSDVVFLEPFRLDEIAEKGDRPLLILRRKE